VTGNRFDSGDYLIVCHFFNRCGFEAGIAPIHHDRPVAFRIIPESANQLTPFHVVHGPEIHRLSPS